MTETRQIETSEKTPPKAIQKSKTEEISDITLDTTSDVLFKSSQNEISYEGAPPPSLLVPELADNDPKDDPESQDLSRIQETFLSTTARGPKESRQIERDFSSEMQAITETGVHSSQRDAISIRHNERLVQIPKKMDKSQNKPNESKADKEKSNRHTPTNVSETKNVAGTSEQHVTEDHSLHSSHHMNESHFKRYRSHNESHSREGNVMESFESSELHPDFKQNQTRDSFRESRSGHNATSSRERQKYSSHISVVNRKGDSQQKASIHENINHQPVARLDAYNHALGSPTVSIDERQQLPNHGSTPTRHYRNVKENKSPNPPQILRVHTNNLSDTGNFFERSPGNNSISITAKKHSRKGHSGIEMAPSMLLFNNSFDDSLSSPDLGNFSLDRNTFNAFGSDLGSPKHILSNSRERNFINISASDRHRSSRAPFPSQNSPSMSVMMIGGSSSNSLSPRDEFSSGFVIGDSPSVKIRTAHNEETPPGKYGNNQSSRFQSHFPKADIVCKSIYSSGPEYKSRSMSRDIHDSQSKTVSPPERTTTTKEVPNFYFILRRYRKAFSHFTFVLPGLRMHSFELRQIKSVDTLDLDLSYKKDFRSTPDGECTKDDRKAAFMPEPSMTPTRVKNHELSPSDIIIVRRRLTATVCLFGGTISQKTKKKRNQSNVSSIFRRQREIDVSEQTKTPSQIKYEQNLPMRYYENDNRLSWEVEEHPPIEVVTDDEDNGFGKPFEMRQAETLERQQRKRARISSHDSSIKPIPSHVDSGMLNRLPMSYGESLKSAFGAESPTPVSAMGIVTNCGEAPKMKYRCKLCGQPKQNHTCPFTQSLQRSIGTMSYACTNAYNADEPGKLSLRLSEMNNFTINGEGQGPYQSKKSNSLRSSNGDGEELTSSFEKDTSKIQRNFQSSRMSNKNTGAPKQININDDYCLRISEGKRRTAVYSAQKRPSTQDSSQDEIFQKTMDINEEQFRTITPTNNSESISSYKYPALPLTYGQRKRLSDSLFTLSKEVTGLTDECADVLREARETDMWDLAIAELLTQVLVIIHCSETDDKMNGLQQYLLTLGVSC